MHSQLESERSTLRANLITTDRPDSSQLVDLHVYIIPNNVWKDRQNLAENETMEQAVSAGFVRVPQNLTINDLRQHIRNICGHEEEFPKEFTYLRSVGRCLTKVKPQQETDLRVKNYRPPMTFAPEIYILEGRPDDDPPGMVHSRSFLFRESPIHPSLSTPPRGTHSRQQSWTKSIAAPPPPLPSYPSFVRSNDRQNSTDLNGTAMNSFSNLSTASSTLSARDLAKLREEQERLRLRQVELARQRREIEHEQQRHEKELLAKQEYVSKERREKEEAAATRIQGAYRDFRNRRQIKEQRQRENEDDVHSDKQRLAALEIERLQREARELTRRKAEEEHAEEIEAHDVVKLSHRLEELKTKRVELEATRETVVRRMQQLHAQVSVRRKEERDLWKQKYLIEKKKTASLEERTRLASVQNDQPDINAQFEQAKIRLNNCTKLRQQAENECRILRQELQQVRLGLTAIEKHPLPKQPPPIQQTIPISLDITLQY